MNDNTFNSKIDKNLHPFLYKKNDKDIQNEAKRFGLPYDFYKKMKEEYFLFMRQSDFIEHCYSGDFGDEVKHGIEKRLKETNNISPTTLMNDLYKTNNLNSFGFPQIDHKELKKNFDDLKETEKEDFYNEVIFDNEYNRKVYTLQKGWEFLIKDFDTKTKLEKITDRYNDVAIYWKKRESEIPLVNQSIPELDALGQLRLKYSEKLEVEKLKTSPLDKFIKLEAERTKFYNEIREDNEQYSDKQENKIYKALSKITMSEIENKMPINTDKFFEYPKKLLGESYFADKRCWSYLTDSIYDLVSTHCQSLVQKDQKEFLKEYSEKFEKDYKKINEKRIHNINSKLENNLTESQKNQIIKESEKECVKNSNENIEQNINIKNHRI